MNLYYKGNQTATFFIWTTDSNQTICFTTKENPPHIYLAKNPASQISFNIPMRLPQSGIWEFILKPQDRAVRFSIESDDGAYPFVIPGPGITKSHFPDPGPALLFDAFKGSQDFYIDVPTAVSELSINYWTNIDAPCKVFSPSGKAAKVKWMPNSKGMPYRLGDIPVNEFGFWRAVLDTNNAPFRFTEWHGLPVFNKKPPMPFPYRYVRSMAKLSHRVTVTRNGAKESTWDLKKDEQQVIPVVEGNLSFELWAGMNYDCMQKTLYVNTDIDLDVSLNRILDVPKDWKRGDHHMHSYFEDGGSSPDKMVRAGLANGLDYQFITDLDARELLDNNLQQHNLENKFLALPGQEMFSKNSHMNALNVRKKIDTSGDEGTWISQVEAYDTDEHPAMIMLNHPSHIKKVMESSAYFRSWWVAAKYDNISLVENCDFQTWFDFLNRGRKMTVLWTTDSHDSTYYMAGTKSTFINTYGKLSERDIIDALRNGRATNCAYPGAFLNLNVNGVGIGGTASYHDGKITIDVSCDAAVKLHYIELVADGNVIYNFHIGDSNRFAGRFICEKKVNWIIARAYFGYEWQKDGTSMDEFIQSGCRAFTNPVYIQN